MANNKILYCLFACVPRRVKLVFSYRTQFQPISTTSHSSFVQYNGTSAKETETTQREERMRVEWSEEKKTHESMILLHLIILMDTSLLLWRYEKHTEREKVLSKANSSNKVTSGCNL